MAVRWATDFVPAGTSACVDPQKVRRLGRGCHRLSNLVAAVALIAVLHGRELRAEELLHAMSQYLDVGSIVCGR